MCVWVQELEINVFCASVVWESVLESPENALKQ